MPIEYIDADDKKISCKDLDSIRHFPLKLHLSRRFTLGEVSRNLSRHAEVSKLSQNEIVCNLRNISLNVLDKIKDQYEQMTVMHGHTPPMPDTFAYAYNRGLAVLIEFSYLPANDIVPLVAWIRANVKYSQMLLVWTAKTTGKLNVSLAIAYGSTVNVPEEGTVFNGVLYRNYLTTITAA